MGIHFTAALTNIDGPEDILQEETWGISVVQSRVFEVFS